MKQSDLGKSLDPTLRYFTLNTCSQLFTKVCTSCNAFSAPGCKAGILVASKRSYCFFPPWRLPASSLVRLLRTRSVSTRLIRGSVQDRATNHYKVFLIRGDKRRRSALLMSTTAFAFALFIINVCMFFF
jgi:hypothetical protein